MCWWRPGGSGRRRHLGGWGQWPYSLCTARQPGLVIQSFLAGAADVAQRATIPVLECLPCCSSPFTGNWQAPSSRG